jgi:CubicO group peptidase (beta-lactamase class C family)
VALVARVRANPAVEVSPRWLIRLVAWQPLRFTPGSRQHHSNTGWDIIGLIAARAGGKPLPVLYQERIVEPLGLDRTAYDPQGPINGPHAHGYAIAGDGTLTDTTTWAPFKGADGAIVANAQETARFFIALMGAKLFDRHQLVAMNREQFVGFGGADSGCAGLVHSGSGGGNAYKSNVLVNDNGSRVAVLLLNGRTVKSNGDPTAAAATLRLYCAA